MKKFILIVGVFILLLIRNVSANIDLSKLVGKQVYRDVPAQNETAYDTAYQNTPYTIDSYNENIMSLRDEDGNLIILGRDLWDDGNWKEYGNSLKSLIGKFIYRSKAVVMPSHPLGIDGSFISGKWLLIDVGKETFTIHKDGVDGEKFKLSKKTWDDGNWKECIDSNEITKDMLFRHYIGTMTCRQQPIKIKCELVVGDKTLDRKNTHDLKIGDTVKTTNRYYENFKTSMTGKIVDIVIVPSYRHEYYYPSNRVATLDNGERLSIDWLEKCDIKTVGKWYIGQKVWDVLEGRGTIEKVEDAYRFDNGLMAIKVKMDSGGYRWYSLKGRYASNYEVCRLYPVETKSINFTLDRLFPEKRPKRLIVNEMVGTETFHTMHYGETSYHCVRCGRSLKLNLTEYYCLFCKVGWGIKGE